ncbi:MAG: SHOCT domain-containing protein [Actinomycetota bacterium]|nr:SHOCT domain-containing protein [Actinomycetota bacterium]
MVASIAEASVTSMLGSFVADELRKLAGMRDAGALSQEEYDGQKAKLLSQS